MRLYLLTFFTVLSAALSAQNAYLFVEPFTSVSYDSTVIKKGSRYPAFDGTERYMFNYIDNGNRLIYISSDNNIQNNVSLRVQDSVVTAVAATVVGPKDSDNFNADTAIRHINGFSCMAFSANYKILGVKSVTIVGARSYDWGLTKIVFTADNTIDKQNEFAVFEDFLKGVKMYSNAQIAKEDSIIKEQCTPVIKQTEVPRYMPAKYAANISIQGSFRGKYVGVEVIDSPIQKSLYDAKNGMAEVWINDDTVGKVTKKANLIVLNQFGKKVHIPFTITYTNN